MLGAVVPLVWVLTALNMHVLVNYMHARARGTHLLAVLAAVLSSVPHTHKHEL
jgi:hypothetical protein